MINQIIYFDNETLTDNHLFISYFYCEESDSLQIFISSSEHSRTINPTNNWISQCPSEQFALIADHISLYQSIHLSQLTHKTVCIVVINNQPSTIYTIRNIVNRQLIALLTKTKSVTYTIISQQLYISLIRWKDHFEKAYRFGLLQSSIFLTPIR